MTDLEMRNMVRDACDVLGVYLEHSLIKSIANKLEDLIIFYKGKDLSEKYLNRKYKEFCIKEIKHWKGIK